MFRVIERMLPQKKQKVQQEEACNNEVAHRGEESRDCLIKKKMPKIRIIVRRGIKCWSVSIIIAKRFQWRKWRHKI
jgi:hypothetical protein